jgi:hypothetical protein
MTNGTIERKCMKGHKKAEGRCSPRCVRWYPRIQRATSEGHSRRRFDYLGGYPTKAAARAALHQALGRQGDNVAPDHPSKTSNDDVDGTMRLRNCPFDRIADRHRQLVCGANHAMLQALTDQVDGDPPTVRAVLDPQPGRCCVVLTRDS